MYGIKIESTMTSYTAIYTSDDKAKLLSLDSEILENFEMLLAIETDDDFYTADEKQAEFLERNNLTAYIENGYSLSGRVWDIGYIYDDDGEITCDIVATHKWRF